jgi:cell division protein FtsI/penicillin-binding protein 2
MKIFLFCFFSVPILLGKSPSLDLSESILYLNEKKAIKKFQPLLDQKLPSSLDVRIQSILKKLFRTQGYSAGGVVLLDPKTGQLLGLGSYDRRWQKDPNFQILTKAQLPAASLLKIVTLAAFLSKNDQPIDTEFRYRQTCQVLTPSTWFPHERLDRSKMSLKKAFAKSCNSVFGRLVVQLGYEPFKDELKKFGFFQPLGGNVVTSASHVDFYPKSEMLSGDLAALGSGLGFSKISLIHAALMSAPFANSGHWVKPTLSSHSEKSVSALFPVGVIEQLKKAMNETARSGTAKRFFQTETLLPLVEQNLIGLKTGTLCRYRSRDLVTLTTGYVLESPIGPYVFSTAVLTANRYRFNASRLAARVISALDGL